MKQIRRRLERFMDQTRLVDPEPQQCLVAAYPLLAGLHVTHVSG